MSAFPIPFVPPVLTANDLSMVLALSMQNRLKFHQIPIRMTDYWLFVNFDSTLRTDNCFIAEINEETREILTIFGATLYKKRAL